MADFGFNISKPQSIDTNDMDVNRLQALEEKVPSFRSCISCGTCTATCSARQFGSFNIRRIHNLYRWDQRKGLEKEMQKCMLCGKCTLVCPRGVNLRSLIIHIRKALADKK
ncbi:MAG: 4Fe-4S dicluster domain-containing protein [Bacteroidales bacterium]